MIGCLQWAVSLGRFDTQTATMTMSRFRVAPRKGHLERLKRIYGFLKKFASAAIRVRIDQPELPSMPDRKFEWCHTVYGNVEELIPRDAPKPLGKSVTTMTYTNKNRKVNTSESVPDTVQVGDTTCYLNKGETINVQGHQYSAHMARVHYRVGQHDVAMMEKALVDRGANGGICGDDMLVLEGSNRVVDVVGLAGHKVSQLRIVTSQALVSSHKGDVIATFHQMALLGKGKSILSCLQMEAYGADINDRSRLLPGGKQGILMDGYQMPLEFKNGLAYLRCRKPTDEELCSLPHVIMMTSDIDWDPSLYDNIIENIEEFHDTSIDDHKDPNF